jgi:hypothetical protein
MQNVLVLDRVFDFWRQLRRSPSTRAKNRTFCLINGLIDCLIDRVIFFFGWAEEKAKHEAKMRTLNYLIDGLIDW